MRTTSEAHLRKQVLIGLIRQSWKAAVGANGLLIRQERKDRGTVVCQGNRN